MSIEHGLPPRGRVLIDRLELLCCFMKNGINRHPDEKLLLTSKFHAFTRNIEKSSLEVTQWLVTLQQERSNFNSFQRDVEVNRKAAQHAKDNIEKNVKQSLAVQAGNIAMNISIGNLKTDARKRSTRTEMDLFNRYTVLHDKERRSVMSNLYNTRCKTKTQYLNQVVKYDNDIRALYEWKNALLKWKNFIESDYSITQGQLIEQRNLYRRLKMECEMDRKEAFLKILEQFCRNRAAKLIQRNWKLYRIRASWKKRRSRR